MESPNFKSHYTEELKSKFGCQNYRSDSFNMEVRITM